MVIESLILIFIAYLFGSISSAIVVAKLMNLPDPRAHGSNNPGATNVLRIGGKKAAIITLLGDVLKGFIPVLLAKALGLPAIGISLVALAAFLGHLFPIFFGFKGGKGVATAFGCLMALAWPVGVFLFLTWIGVAVLFRYSSLASLTSSFLAPFFVAFFGTESDLIVTFIMSTVLIYRHKANIQKLWLGQESKIGKKI